jgi:hypothetical protein
MFRKAEGRHARAFQADGRAINEKVRLYARVGAALISAHDDEKDAFGAITAVISWERYRATVAEAQALARPETFDAYQKMGEHYAGIRRWSPAFLAAFEFESVPTSASLMRDIEGAARGKQYGSVGPAELRANRIRPPALGVLRAARRRNRPPPL